MDRTLTNEFMRTKDFMGTGGLQNYSMIMKQEESLMGFEYTDNSFGDHLNTMHFHGEFDEPIRSKKTTKVSNDVNISTYITLEHQMNNKFRER